MNPEAQQRADLRPGDLVDDREAAALLSLDVRTLRNWRVLGKGPRFRKLGERTVRYHRADLLSFIEGGVAA
jgi:hypothetical protein